MNIYVCDVLCCTYVLYEQNRGRKIKEEEVEYTDLLDLNKNQHDKKQTNQSKPPEREKERELGFSKKRTKQMQHGRSGD